MTRLEIAKVLNKIMVDNRISIIDRDNCHFEYESQINSMQDIFDLKKQTDFTYLYAVSELLGDDFENINEYLLKENKDSKLVKNIPLPTRKDKILVATAFEENLEFFSMAWNWGAIVTAELAEQSKNLTNSKNIFLFKNREDLKKSISKNVDYDIIVAAASESGFSNITRIPVDLLGEIEILGNRETKRLLFTLFLNPEVYKLKFELTIDFEVQGVYKTAVLRKDTEAESKEINSMPIHIDFTQGFKLKKVTWNHL